MKAVQLMNILGALPGLTEVEIDGALKVDGNVIAQDTKPETAE